MPVPHLPAPARRFAPLLPPERRLGWVPYAWLVYLPMAYVVPAIRGASALEWAALALGTVVFLASYFVGYRAHNRALAVAVGAQVVLGVAFVAGFGNFGASVFLVYASAFAAQLAPPRAGVLGVAAVTALALLLTWLVAPPVAYWVTTAVFVPLIGAVNYHVAQQDRANARLRRAQEEVEQLAAVAERERIARDLHDVLGHTLSLVVVKAQLAARLAERDPARAAQEMRDVEGVARAALGEVRETIRGYRATVSDELAHAAALLRASGVALDVARDPAALDGIERPAEEALALALREAVTNVARHAGASRCTVQVRRSDAHCELVVDDDGRGGGDDGAGLRGMRERIERLGGSVERASRAGGGTRLVVRLPLAGDASPASTPPPAAIGAPA